MFLHKKFATALAPTLIGIAGLVLPCASLQAEEAASPVDPAVIMAYAGDVYLTQAELDAAFNKLPEQDRLAYIRDGAKVDQLIKNLMRLKAIANEARKAEFDQSPLMPETLALAAEKELAGDWLLQVVNDAPVPDFKAMAYEDYIANPDRYRGEESLDLSHILIGNEQRSNQDAEQLAMLLAGRLEDDPSLFGELVEEYSDDPAKVNNAGRYPDMRKGQMVAPFEKAAFALTEPGQISDPVKTQYGYHIIRLNARSGGDLPEFSTIEDQAVEVVRQKYYDNYQQDYIRKVTSEPIILPEGAVEIMAKRHFGEDLELAPDFNEVDD